MAKKVSRHQPALVYENRTTSLHHECRVCEIIMAPQMVTAVFEVYQHPETKRPTPRVWGFCHLNHTTTEIEKAYKRWETRVPVR